MGCPGMGGRNFDKRNVIIIESMGCPGRGGGNFDKRNVIIIESMGWGGEIVIRRKSLKAWVANKGGWKLR